MFIEYRFKAAVDGRILIFRGRILSRQDRPEYGTIEIGSQPRPAEAHQLREMRLVEVKQAGQVTVKCSADHNTRSAKRHIDQGIEFPAAEPCDRIGVLALFE